VALVYKLHIILGLTLFLITPFTRLVHIWSAPIWFLFRPGYQIVRSRSLKRPDYSRTHGPAGVAPTTVDRRSFGSRRKVGKKHEPAP
jgi:nitrate reductase gamma subunit